MSAAAAESKLEGMFCCHEQVINSARELLTKLPLLADAALVWTMHITFHSFCLLLLLLLPPRAAALDRFNRPTTPGILPRRLRVRHRRPRRIPPAVIQCVLLTEQGPMLFLIRVMGGNPTPLEFGTKWGGSCSVQASDREFRSTSQVDTTPLQCKRSAGGKIVEDATMTALPPPGVRCRPQLPAPSAALTYALAVALRGEATTTAAQGRASWWMQGGGAARGNTTTSRGEREANGRWSRRCGMRRRPSRGREERMGGGGAVSRCDTATSRCEGGVEDGYVRRYRDERWREAEAARRESTRTRGKREERRQWTKGDGA